MPDPQTKYDVAIVGGGLVGLTLAIALDRAGLSVALVDADEPAKLARDAFDGRAAAIATGSARVLQGLGLWPLIAPHAEPIRDIRVSDGDSSLFLHYDHRELGSDPFGYIVENRFTRRALYAALRNTAVDLRAPARATATATDATQATLTLDDGSRIEARLVVACDGRPSPLRKGAGIRALRWDYAQAAIVCAIRHELPHAGIAHERFLPSGPFAMLPLPDGPDGSHRSSIVWTERAELADHLIALPDDEFADEIHERFGWGLGALAPVAQRWRYPLTFVQAERATAPRLVLAGDALHGIHPIAGQGLNLGLRDVMALRDAVDETSDPGAPTVVAAYDRARQADVRLRTGAVDTLNRTLLTDLMPADLLRGAGLLALSRIGPLRRLVMRQGLAGGMAR